MKLDGLAACAAIFIGCGLASTGAHAFGHGCGDRAVECYEKVRRPDVYATVKRRVLVSPSTAEVVRTPAIYGSRAERVVIEPGRVERVREPAVYTTRLKRVMVRQPRVSYEHVPAVVKTVRQRVEVGTSGYRWERRRDLFGRERLCKVQIAPRTKIVERRVVVTPAAKVRRITPAVYEQVPERVLVREARTRRIYSPEVSTIVHRRVMLTPPDVRVVHHPAVIGTTHERVLVRSGGYEWRASHSRRGLFER